MSEISPERSGQDREWHGQQRKAEVDRLVATILGPEPEPVWCPTANVLRERAGGVSGVGIKRGTRLLAPGAKVFVFPHLWDSHDAQAQLKVVGRHRGSHRYITLVLPARYLTGWRVELVYSPYVIRTFLREIMKQFWWPDQTVEENMVRLPRLSWTGTQESKAQAERMVALMRAVLISPQSNGVGGADADRRE